MTFFDKLDPKKIEFIEKQSLFFTATAPDEGRINLSPKGLDTFRIFSESLVGYLDITGSGNETSAHIQENGRLTFMFCSFNKDPLILRLYGKGEVVKMGSDRWDEFSDSFEHLPGERQIILLHVENGQTSCGFGVPVYELVQERKVLTDWAEKKGDEGIVEYQKKNNLTSIDGKKIDL